MLIGQEAIRASVEERDTLWFRPFVPRALGNSVVDHIALGKHKLRTGQKIGLVYPPNIDFHKDLIACNPYIDATCSIGSFPTDARALPEPTRGRTWNYLIENTEIARLRLPAGIEDELAPVLECHDIGPSDRVIAIHAREPGYKYYARDHEPERFVDVANFISVARHYLARGFKIIRIGDPSCTPFPPMRGLLDAAFLAGRSLIHDMLFVKRAAVLLATDSGVWPLGVALGTPTVLSNSCHGQPAMGTVKHWFPWEPGHRVLNKSLYYKGVRLSPEQGVLFFKGQRWREIRGQTVLEDNTVEELVGSVDSLLSSPRTERRS